MEPNFHDRISWNQCDLNTTLKLSVFKCFPMPTNFEVAHTQYYSLQPKGATVGTKWE